MSRAHGMRPTMDGDQLREIDAATAAEANDAQALKTLVGQGVRLCYTSQTLAEFWNASTRPLDKNGFGLSIAETDRLARVIERDFELLPDSRETHERWRALIVQYGVQGVQVHDARIAASMYVHGVGQLLTINVRDFKRFDNLRVTNPADVPPTKAKP